MTLVVIVKYFYSVLIREHKVKSTWRFKSDLSQWFQNQTVSCQAIENFLCFANIQASQCRATSYSKCHCSIINYIKDYQIYFLICISSLVALFNVLRCCANVIGEWISESNKRPKTERPIYLHAMGMNSAFSLFLTSQRKISFLSFYFSIFIL